MWLRLIPMRLFDMIFSSGEPELRLKLQDAGGHRPTVSQAMAFTDSLRQHFPEVMIPPVVTEENLQLVADVEQMTIYGISYTGEGGPGVDIGIFHRYQGWGEHTFEPVAEGAYGV